MKIFRLIIASIVILFLICTIISFFIPSDVRVSKAIQVNAAKDAVMRELDDPSKWKDWYPDAASSKYYYEHDTVKGLVLDEEKNQFIVMTGKNENEVSATYHQRGKKILTGWQIASASNTNSVTVQWYLEFHLRWYPWEKFTSFLFEKVYQPQLQKGLDNLKTLLEK